MCKIMASHQASDCSSAYHGKRYHPYELHHKSRNNGQYNSDGNAQSSGGGSSRGNKTRRNPGGTRTLERGDDSPRDSSRVTMPGGTDETRKTRKTTGKFDGLLVRCSY